MRKEEQRERERGNKEICQRAIHSRKVTALEGKCSKDTGMDYLIVPSRLRISFIRILVKRRERLRCSNIHRNMVGLRKFIFTLKLVEKVR